MKSWIRKISVVAFVVLVIGGAGSLWLSGKYVVPVIMYHRIDPHPEGRADTVSPEHFERQIRFFKEHGYRILTLDELVVAKKSGHLPRKSLTITFDDGEINNFTEAFPILKKYGVPATFFVIPGFAGRKDFLGYEQMLIMQQGGMSFGSHGMTHAYLPELSSERQLFEILESKKALEKKLNRPVRFFAYPIGGFDQMIKSELKAAGYVAAFTTNRGNDRFDDDLFEINRIRFSDKNVSWLDLTAKLSGYYNFFRTLKKEK